MQHPSTFQIKIAGALCHEQDVMAEIQSDGAGEWFVAEVYVDPLERPDGTRARGYDWVLVPRTDRFHADIVNHFYGECHDAIAERWERNRSWRIQPQQAGRVL